MLGNPQLHLTKDEDFSRRLVMSGGAIVGVLGALLVLAHWLEGSDDIVIRVVLYSLAASVGFSSLYIGYLGKWRFATYLLVWGMWTVIVLVAIWNGGIRSNNHMGFPAMIVFSGWALGKRPTLWLLGVTLLVMAVFKAADQMGYMPPTPFPPTWAYMLYSFGMLCMTATVTLWARSYFMQRAADAQAALKKLKSSENELRQLSLAIEHCPASIVITSFDERVVYANPEFLRTSGYRLEEVMGKRSVEVSTTGMDARLRAEARALLAKGEIWRGDLINRRKDGSEVIEDVRVAPIPRDDDESGAYFMELKQDITNRVQAEATIHQLSYFDGITGLPNRFALLKRLVELKEATRGRSCHVNECPRHGILVLDIDRFTGFNDVHGSLMGDELLRAVSMRLSSLMVPNGLLVRTSGDEFVVVLERIASNIQDAEVMVEAFSHRLVQSLESQPLWLGANHGTVRVTCCIGMSVFPSVENDSEIEAMRRANTALHEAKSQGPGYAVIFQDVMAENASRRYRIEKGLRKAIAENELRLFLQGQFDAQGRPLGAEALVRWEHPERGMIAPNVFIPVAEESDLIVLLGDWVLQESCKLLQHPLVKENRLLISVNVSARQFLESSFEPKLRRLLESTGADPSLLVMEVTEGLVLTDFDEAAQKMKNLRDLGVQFALDDFGTGYSSMAYLTRLPIQEIKVDQSFIHKLPESEHNQALVEAILSVSSRFGLRVVAEGVETREQAVMLYGWDNKVWCQGYLHDKPTHWETWLQGYEAFALTQHPAS